MVTHKAGKINSDVCMCVALCSMLEQPAEQGNGVCCELLHGEGLYMSTELTERAGTILCTYIKVGKGEGGEGRKIQ